MKSNSSDLLEKLKQVARLAARSEFYANRLVEMGIKIDDISSIEGFRKLPLITSPDMREHSRTFPAVPRDQIAALFASGGTTGKPKIMYWTEEGLDESSGIVASHLEKFFPMRGKLCVLIVPGDNLAIVGTIMRKALHMMGATTAMMGLMFTQEQKKELIDVLREEEPYLLMGNPARLLSLLKDCKEMGVDPKTFGLTYTMSTSEVLQDKTKKLIEDSFGAKVIQQSGMTEVAGISIECSERNGMHVLEEGVFLEVCDPETGESIMEGVGEIYVTNLTNPAYPLVRYRTEDLARITYKSCPCGLESPRLWYKCRLSESVSLKGHTIYAYQIDEALNAIPELSPHFSLSVESEDGVSLAVECDAASRSDETLAKLRKILQESVPPLAQVEFTLTFVDIESLTRTPRGKVAKRMQDLRGEKV